MISYAKIVITWGLVLLALGTLAPTARAVTYDFTKIRDTAGTNNILIGTASLNNQGNVVFGMCTDTDCAGEGIFYSDGTSTFTVAEILPGEGSVVATPKINDFNQVAYTVNTSGIAVYRWSSDSGNVLIADSQFQATGLGVRPVESGGINNDGTVAFLATEYDVSGQTNTVFTGDGGQLTTVFPDVQSLTGTAVISDSGTVAVSVRQTRQGAVDLRSIQTSDGTQTTIIAVNDDPTFHDFHAVSLNDVGDVAFSSFKDDLSMSLYVSQTGSLQHVLDSQTIQGVAINNAGLLAFKEGYSEEIFTIGDSLNRVLGQGDALDGRVIDQVQFSDALNDFGQLALRVDFVDGTQGIYRADPIIDDPEPVPAPPGLLLLALGVVVISLRRRT